MQFYYYKPATLCKPANFSFPEGGRFRRFHCTHNPPLTNGFPFKFLGNTTQALWNHSRHKLHLIMNPSTPRRHKQNGVSKLSDCIFIRLRRRSSGGCCKVGNINENVPFLCHKPLNSWYKLMLFIFISDIYF